MHIKILRDKRREDCILGSVKTRARSRYAKYNGARSNGLAVTPVRNPLYNESSWCVPSSRGERKMHGRRERKEERKRRDAGREVLLREETLPFRRFSALVPSQGAIRVKEEGRGPGGSEKWGPRRGHVSRSGHLPLKRTHCYVPIISFTLAASHLPFSPFVFLLLLLLSPPPIFSYTARLPFISLCLGTSSCPFPYKADLRTCPSRRMTVNRSRGDHRDVLPTDERKSGVTSR